MHAFVRSFLYICIYIMNKQTPSYLHNPAIYNAGLNLIPIHTMIGPNAYIFPMPSIKTSQSFFIVFLSLIYILSAYVCVCVCVFMCFVCVCERTRGSTTTTTTTREMHLNSVINAWSGVLCVCSSSNI